MLKLNYTTTSNDSNNISFTTLNDYENEDEIKRYLKDKDGGGHDTIIAVLEGDYVRFAKELKNRNLTKE